MDGTTSHIFIQQGECEQPPIPRVLASIKYAFPNTGFQHIDITELQKCLPWSLYHVTH